MGINTYKNCGPQSNAITSHIDFIFDVAWATALAVNKANYNNGTSESPVPWLASNAYLFVNSESGLVPSTATADPTLVESDYT